MKIITLGKYGALGNNFFRLLHVFAYAKHQNAELYYSDRRNIDRYFVVDESFIRHKKTPEILNSRLLRSVLRRIDKSPRMVRLINRMNIYLHDHMSTVQRDEQLALACRKKNAIVFVLRDFRVHRSIDQYVDQLRKSFDIRPELTIEIDKMYNEIRNKYQVLIGVHIRRGDYKEWNEGRYYFPDEVYATKIHQFISFLNIRKEEVGIIICSNGAPLLENFPGLNVYIDSRPEQEDLFLMKRCDYILAPPSTFCSMSSFLGSVPIYFIEPDETRLFSERLHVCSY